MGGCECMIVYDWVCICIYLSHSHSHYLSFSFSSYTGWYVYVRYICVCVYVSRWCCAWTMGMVCVYEREREREHHTLFSSTPHVSLPTLSQFLFLSLTMVVITEPPPSAWYPSKTDSVPGFTTTSDYPCDGLLEQEERKEKRTEEDNIGEKFINFRSQFPSNFWASKTPWIKGVKPLRNERAMRLQR